MVGMGNNVYGRARYTDSLVNQNFGGGVKKQGLAPTIGLPASVSAIYLNRIGCFCPTAYAMVNSVRTCGTNVGGRTVKPRC